MSANFGDYGPGVRDGLADWLRNLSDRIDAGAASDSELRELAALRVQLEARREPRAHFRGVVWPRQLPGEVLVSTPYRYAIVGVLVTEEPIDRFAEPEHPLDGPAPGLGEALAQVAPGRPPGKLGDATDVLLGLDGWQDSTATARARRDELEARLVYLAEHLGAGR